MQMPVANNIVAAVLVFLNAAVSDYLEAKYVEAVNDKNPERASGCSILMWVVGVIGLVAVLEVGWWVLAPEAAGLYLGTRLAMRRQPA